jgi:hypothetical protein
MWQSLYRRQIEMIRVLRSQMEDWEVQWEDWEVQREEYRSCKGIKVMFLVLNDRG